LSAGLKAAKKALRERVIAQRDALSPAAREAQTQSILHSLLCLPAYKSASVVAAYASMASEFGTAEFMRHALGEGKQLLLPRIDKAKHRLDLHAVTDLQSDLVPGIWGIREPAPHCQRVDASKADFMLVPGVAFTKRGERLGYGGGYYDRLLTEVAPDTRRVAAAFAIQIVEEMPLDEHDQPVHVIVTNLRTLVA